MHVAALVLLLAASWFKGNTHTHTLESDGDSPPAEVVKWYHDRGYSFLVITDHDKITRVDNAPMLLIAGEEITDHIPGKPLHLNAIGLKTVVKPGGGKTVVDTLQGNINAARAVGGIVAVNHPNFGWAFGSDELLKLTDYTLLEIASGHPYVNMAGPPSVEEMWDVLLTAGRRVWGIAVDDSHHLKRPWDTDMAPPGKAWIVVRAEKLDEPSILDSLRRGDFYASTGVEITDYQVDAKSMTVSIKAKNQARYRTMFIGPNGRLLGETTANPATFVLPERGYVRARVIDSNGRMAWLQPHFVSRR